MTPSACPTGVHGDAASVAGRSSSRPSRVTAYSVLCPYAIATTPGAGSTSTGVQLVSKSTGGRCQSLKAEIAHNPPPPLGGSFPRPPAIACTPLAWPTGVHGSIGAIVPCDHSLSWLFATHSLEAAAACAGLSSAVTSSVRTSPPSTAQRAHRARLSSRDI